jgi:hypothetical protein
MVVLAQLPEVGVKHPELLLPPEVVAHYAAGCESQSHGWIVEAVDERL